MQTHIDHLITWIYFEDLFSPLQWVHLPRYQIIGENTCPVCVFRPSCGWVEISNGDNICLDARYQSIEILVKRLKEQYAAEEVLKTMEDYAKKNCGLACSGGR